MTTRRLRPILAALALPLCLAGCATSSSVSVPLRLATIPQSLTVPCADPADIPARDLTTAEVARLWGRDRIELGACRDRHDALSRATREIEAQGQGPAS